MKYMKKCPSCSHLNPSSAFACENCDIELPASSLTPVDVLPESHFQDTSVNENSNKEAVQQEAYKRCPKCNNIYPYSVNKCSCGYSLQAEAPVFLNKAQVKQTSYSIRSEDGYATLDIQPGQEYILGSEAELSQYLAMKTYVSRQHATLSYLGGHLRIKHIGHTNPTLINGNEIEYEKLYTLLPGDKIALGARKGQGIVAKAAYFKVIANTTEEGGCNERNQPIS